MKKFNLRYLLPAVLLIMFPLATLSAAPHNPVSWSVTSVSLENDEHLIRAVGTTESPEWHIYDLTEYHGGPNCTSMTIEDASLVSSPHIVSPVQKVYDEVFAQEIGTCSGPVTIEATVKSSLPEVRVTIGWQACKDGMCMAPEEYSVAVSLGGTAEVSVTQAESVAPSAVRGQSSSLWKLIAQAVTWGFVALLTPCVFPMIPLTVSFFLKRNGNEKRKRGKSLAAFFGLSIVLLYTVPIALIIGLSLLTGGQAVTADIFNFFATHWIPNLLFFIVFMVFAASFLGAFDLSLPSGLVNRFDSKSEMGGLAGAFFVALTLVLVSFSCTGPIVGSVLIKSSQGEFWEPIVTMLAFSVAFSLPFTIFAFAPSLMKKLPKSGGWLGSVKIVLGFLEIAFGLKFLSVADQTYHWGILDREVYLAIWIVVFSLMGLYLLGKLKFKNESPVEGIGIIRLTLSIAVFSFVVYMIPGMWGAPLKAISGYLPPIETQDFVSGRYSNSRPEAPASAYDEALAEAKASGKPLLLDFTGYGCVNCREMDARVLSDERVSRILDEKYVVCRLYTDDRTALPEESWVTTDDGKVLKSIGKANSYFELKKFGMNAQPYYIILDPYTEQQKTLPHSYNLNVEAFVDFLQSGL